MKLPLPFLNRFRTILVGFIGGLMILILWELRELPLLLVASMVCILGAWYLNKKIAHHFHGHHHHAGDSAIDIVAPTVLILANVLHPAVDGFTVYQTFIQSGTAAGVVVGSGVALHEILRQSALIAAFRFVGIRWYVVVITAVVGMGGGILLGVLQSGLVDRYEVIADLATIFAYAFVISEYSIHEKQGVPERRWVGIAAGILLALALHFFMALY